MLITPFLQKQSCTGREGGLEGPNSMIFSFIESVASSKESSLQTAVYVSPYSITSFLNLVWDSASHNCLVLTVHMSDLTLAIKKKVAIVSRDRSPFSLIEKLMYMGKDRNACVKSIVFLFICLLVYCLPPYNPLHTRMYAPWEPEYCLYSLMLPHALHSDWHIVDIQ